MSTKSMDFKTACELLELDYKSTLTVSEINTAYRNLAFIHSPALNPYSADCHEIMALLNEARAVTIKGLGAPTADEKTANTLDHPPAGPSNSQQATLCIESDQAKVEKESKAPRGYPENK